MQKRNIPPFYFKLFSYYKIPTNFTTIICPFPAHSHLSSILLHCSYFRCGLLPLAVRQLSIQICVRGCDAYRHRYTSRSWELFTKWREPIRLELNSLNNQHAALPTDTAPSLIINAVLTVGVIPFWIRILNNGSHDIRRPRTNIVRLNSSLVYLNSRSFYFNLFYLNLKFIVKGLSFQVKDSRKVNRIRFWMNKKCFPYLLKYNEHISYMSLGETTCLFP